MTEDFLHYIWRSSLFYPLSLNLVQGGDIEVISTGEMNLNSGPDFFNAKIRLGDIMLAGNVEMHVKSSDWYRHGHHHNKAYDSVILQVVLFKDTEVTRTSGEIIPTAEIRFDGRLINNYRHLLRNEFWIPCEPYIHGIDLLKISEWLNCQAVSRLEQKALVLRETYNQNLNNWEETFYQQLARNFGFRLNGAVFELLAKSLPYRLLLKHKDNLLQLEAMLFGQAGMLSSNGDMYYEQLKREFHFLRGKYSLKPLEGHLWRFLRLRPASFPTIRIAQFASFIHNTPPLFSTLTETVDHNGLSRYFKISASEYWDTHFVFNKPSGTNPKNMGVFAFRSIIINTVVPGLYFYGKQKTMHEYCDRALNYLKALPGENNSIISKWRSLGVNAVNALLSQALLQQKNEYCNYRRCLDCEIGNSVITRR